MLSVSFECGKGEVTKYSLVFRINIEIGGVFL